MENGTNSKSRAARTKVRVNYHRNVKTGKKQKKNVSEELNGSLYMYLNHIKVSEYKTLIAGLSLPPDTSLKTVVENLMSMDYHSLLTIRKGVYVLSRNVFWKALFMQVSPDIGKLLARATVGEELKAMYCKYNPVDHYENVRGETTYKHNIWEMVYSECEVALLDSDIRSAFDYILNDGSSSGISKAHVGFKAILDYPFLSVMLGTGYPRFRNAIIHNDSPLYEYLPYPHSTYLEKELSSAKNVVVKRILKDRPEHICIRLTGATIMNTVYKAVKFGYNEALSILLSEEESRCVFEMNVIVQMTEMYHSLIGASIESLEIVYTHFPDAFSLGCLNRERLTTLMKVAIEKEQLDVVAFYIRISTSPNTAKDQDIDVPSITDQESIVKIATVAARHRVPGVLTLLNPWLTDNVLCSIHLQALSSSGSPDFFERCMALMPGEIPHLKPHSLSEGYTVGTITESVLINILCRSDYPCIYRMLMYEWARRKNLTSVLAALREFREADIKAGNFSAFFIAFDDDPYGALDDYLGSMSVEEIAEALCTILKLNRDLTSTEFLDYKSLVDRLIQELDEKLDLKSGPEQGKRYRETVLALRQASKEVLNIYSAAKSPEMFAVMIKEYVDAVYAFIQCSDSVVT